MLKILDLKPTAFGLDINDTSIKVLELQKKRDGFKVNFFNKESLKSGIIERGSIKDEKRLSEAIKSAIKKGKGQKVSLKHVVVSLPEEDSFLQVIQLPKMEESELKTALPIEAENYIPLPIDSVYLDFAVIEPIKDHLDHIDVLIAAMPKKIIDSYVSCIKNAGLVPLALEPESQAIARALIKKEITEKPVILIDFGEDNTDFIVFSGRSIRFTSSLPVSSGRLTAAISKFLSISIGEAEKLKIKYGIGGDKKVFEAMFPVLEELTAGVKKYLNFYQEHASHEHLDSMGAVEKILFSGGGANLNDLAEFISKRINIPTEIGSHWINFGSALNDPLSFTTAVGLAVRGATNNTNI